jgi:hypothetical protein
MRLGLIQPNVTTGDFSRNVRALIEAYRACLDGESGFIIAPAHSLTGPLVGNLRLRSAFPREHEAALNYLSLELAQTPLITVTQVHDYPELVILTHQSIQRHPLNSPLELTVNGISTTITLDAQQSQATSSSLELRFTTTPYFLGETVQTSSNGSCSVTPRLACVASTPDDFVVYPGASSVTAKGKTYQLPTCSPTEQVVDTEDLTDFSDATCPANNNIVDLITFAVSELVQKLGYAGVALLDFPTESSRQKVTTINQVVAQLTQRLGKRAVRRVPARRSPSTISDWASDRGLLLITPYTKTDLLLGSYNYELALLAHVHPFGDLLDSELSPQLSAEQNPDDSIIIALRDQSATDLLAQIPEQEHQVRTIQRALKRAEWNRWRTLRLHSSTTPLQLPLLHRFVD